MQIDRASAIKLGSFAGITAVAGACHYFGLGEEATGLLDTVLVLLGAGAHAVVGHIGLSLIEKVAGHAGGTERARGVQNHEVHCLIGETIARILEREADLAPGGTFGAKYLKRAAAEFRGTNWMTIELTGPETSLGEPEVPEYFTGDAESIKKAPVLEDKEWFALVEKVAGRATFLTEKEQALNFAAAKLHEHFAFELWEAAKEAWKKDDLAWPALILRLLSLILCHAGDAARNAAATAGQMTELRQEVTALRGAIDGVVARVAPDDIPGHIEMLGAIRQYQTDLITNLSRIELGLHTRHDRHDTDLANILDKVAEVKAALDNPRVAPVKEPLINLPNTAKQIFARDGEARQLLDALSPPGPGIVSIAAPPGFGKSAVLALALRMALPDGDPRQAGINGVAVLDAKAALPGIASLAHLLGRITGLQEIAARFTSAADHPDGSLRALFFDFLRQVGRVWLVVENAEEVLAAAAPDGTSGDFQNLLKAWCQTGHQAKLLLLTRHAMQAAPECHRHLRDVEEALLGGLPEDSAVELLCLRLEDTRFRTTKESLLRQIARRLHRVPMALEQFAGYLHLNEEGVDLDQPFLDQNDLLRLGASERMEDLLLRIIGESLKGLDAPALDLVRVVAWAGILVPRSGLMGLHQDGAALLTLLTRSNLLLTHDGTAAEGRSFTMHPLIREAVTESSPAAQDFERIAGVFRTAGTAEWEQTQFRPALTLYTLAERAARIAGKQDDLARMTLGRGNALSGLGRLEEAVSAYDKSIAIRRELVEKEHRLELTNDLAGAIMNRGVALGKLGRLKEAVAVYDEAIAIYRDLVEREHRQELRMNLAAAITNRGASLSTLGRLDEAVADYDEAIGNYRDLVENEHRQELRNNLALAIMGRANALTTLGRLEEAVAGYDQSTAIYRELVEKEHRQELRNDLTWAILNRGVALGDLGRLEEAVAAYDESIAMRRELVEKEHRRELRNDLAGAIMNRGIALGKLGRLEEAVPAYDESIAIRRELVEKEHRQDLRNDLAGTIMNRGIVLSIVGRLEEAVVAYDESIAIRRDLVAKEHRLELRNDLASGIMNWGVALRTLGCLEEAVLAYDESIAIYRGLVEKEHRRELRNELASASMNRGTALRDLGRFEEAVSAYDESIAMYREMVEREGCQELRNELGRAIVNRGIALWDLGRLNEALAAYDNCIAIYRELVEKEHRQELRNELGGAIINRGIALGDLGRLEEEVAAYDESISIYRDLVENQHRRELRSDLASAWYNLATARQKQNAMLPAFEAAHQARKLWEDLVREGMKHLERYLVLATDLETRLAQRSP